MRYPPIIQGCHQGSVQITLGGMQMMEKEIIPLSSRFGMIANMTSGKR